MSNNSNKIGVITEQGFVAGEGLGFNPVNEKELSPNSTTKDTNKDISTNEKKSDK